MQALLRVIVEQLHILDFLLSIVEWWQLLSNFVKTGLGYWLLSWLFCGMFLLLLCGMMNCARKLGKVEQVWDSSIQVPTWEMVDASLSPSHVGYVAQTRILQSNDIPRGLEGLAKKLFFLDTPSCKTFNLWSTLRGWYTSISMINMDKHGLFLSFRITVGSKEKAFAYRASV